jgi:FkbM family methyltransferase
MHNPEFYVIDENRRKILRNLQKENLDLGFTLEKYNKGDASFDDFNYMYYENFEMFGIFDSFGSDYERFGCAIEEGDVVVDIGANIGMFSRRALEGGASRVIAFEPMTDTFSCLLDNSFPQIECHKLAISSKISKLEMFRLETIKNLGGGTSLYLPGREKFGVEEVLAISLKDLMSTGIIPGHIDFLKIDCEGGEYEIIDTLDEEMLGRISKISMEYHAGMIGTSKKEELMSRAISLGFKHFTLYHGDGSLIQLHLWR